MLNQVISHRPLLVPLCGSEQDVQNCDVAISDHDGSPTPFIQAPLPIKTPECSSLKSPSVPDAQPLVGAWNLDPVSQNIGIASLSVVDVPSVALQTTPIAQVVSPFAQLALPTNTVGAIANNIQQTPQVQQGSPNSPDATIIHAEPTTVFLPVTATADVIVGTVTISASKTDDSPLGPAAALVGGAAGGIIGGIGGAIVVDSLINKPPVVNLPPNPLALNPPVQPPNPAVIKPPIPNPLLPNPAAVEPPAIKPPTPDSVLSNPAAIKPPVVEPPIPNSLLPNPAVVEPPVPVPNPPAVNPPVPAPQPPSVNPPVPVPPAINPPAPVLPVQNPVVPNSPEIPRPATPPRPPSLPGSPASGGLLGGLADTIFHIGDKAFKTIGGATTEVIKQGGNWVEAGTGALVGTVGTIAEETTSIVGSTGTILGQSGQIVGQVGQAGGAAAVTLGQTASQAASIAGQVVGQTELTQSQLLEQIAGQVIRNNGQAGNLINNAPVPPVPVLPDLPPGPVAPAPNPVPITPPGSPVLPKPVQLPPLPPVPAVDAPVPPPVPAVPQPIQHLPPPPPPPPPPSGPIPGPALPQPVNPIPGPVPVQQPPTLQQPPRPAPIKIPGGKSIKDNPFLLNQKNPMPVVQRPGMAEDGVTPLDHLHHAGEGDGKTNYPLTRLMGPIRPTIVPQPYGPNEITQINEQWPAQPQPKPQYTGVPKGLEWLNDKPHEQEKPRSQQTAVSSSTRPKKSKKASKKSASVPSTSVKKGTTTPTKKPTWTTSLSAKPTKTKKPKSKAASSSSTPLILDVQKRDMKFPVPLIKLPEVIQMAVFEDALYKEQTSRHWTKNNTSCGYESFRSWEKPNIYPHSIMLGSTIDKYFDKVRSLNSKITWKGSPLPIIPVPVLYRRHGDRNGPSVLTEECNMGPSYELGFAAKNDIFFVHPIMRIAHKNARTYLNIRLVHGLPGCRDPPKGALYIGLPLNQQPFREIQQQCVTKRKSGDPDKGMGFSVFKYHGLCFRYDIIVQTDQANKEFWGFGNTGSPGKGECWR